MFPEAEELFKDFLNLSIRRSLEILPSAFGLVHFVLPVRRLPFLSTFPCTRGYFQGFGRGGSGVSTFAGGRETRS